MNHIYRVVWRSALGTCVAVSESARGRGKSGRAAAPAHRRVPALAALVLGLVLGLGAAPFALAQTATLAAGSTGRTYVNPNGATIVDIAGANGAGLSHNRYTQFNVDAKGLVLNNTTSSSGAMFQQSQLAGQVKSNDYSARAASVILNEVVTSNRSQLAGFAEVLGSKADVVLVNPYGITCGGCGFINTDRVTLSTGLPSFNANGGLAGFTVNQGDILITGNGLNGTAQQILDLVSRSVRIDGNINAQDLGVFAGAQQWSYDSRGVTAAAAPLGAAPVYAIDSSALGGMYANRIRLVSTDAGVGVRMLGNAAANGQDFSLSAAGRVELNNAISAQRDILLASTSNDAAAIALADAALTSGRDMKLDASQGGLAMQRTRVIAGGALGVNTVGNAGFDSSTLSAASMGIASQGALNVGNSGMQASGDIRLASGAATTVGAGDTQAVQSTGGRIDIAAAGGLLNDGTISADAGAVSIRAGQQLANNGTINAGTDLSVADAAGGASQAIDNKGTLIAGLAMTTRAGAVNNSGWMQAGGDNTLDAASLNNSGNLIAATGSATLRVAGVLDNSASVRAGQDVVVAGADGKAAQQLVNSGDMLAARAMRIDAAAISNRSGAWLQAAAGSTVSAASLDNAGSWLLSQQAGASDSVTVSADMTNSGTMHSSGSLALDAGTLANLHVLQAAGNAALNAGKIDNRGGAMIRTGGNLSASFGAGGLSNAGTLQAGNGQAGNGAVLQLQGIDAAQLANASTGLMLGDSVRLSSGGVSNAGVIQGGAGASSVTAVGQLSNTGDAVLTLATAAGGTGAVSAGRIDNDATIQSAGSLDVAIGSGGMDNAGHVLADGDLGLHGQAGGAINLQSKGVLQSASALRISGGGASALRLDGSALGRSATVAMAGGTVIVGAQGVLASQDNLALDARALVLETQGSGATAKTGRILGALSGAQTAQAVVTVGSDFVNDGLVYSGNNLQVSAPNVKIGALGAISAANTLDLKATAGQLDLGAASPAAGAGRIDNSGLLYAGVQLNAQANGELVNSGDIISDKSLFLRANTLTNNRVINAADDVKIVAARLRNEAPGADSLVGTVRDPDTEHVEIESRNDSNGSGGYDGGNKDVAWHYRYTYTVREVYTGALPSIKPQITAGKNMLLAFNGASNKYGVISAGEEMKMQGFSLAAAGTANAGADLGIQDDRNQSFRLSGGSFVNDNLALTSTTYTVDYSTTTKYIALGPATEYEDRLCYSGMDAVCYTNGYETRISGTQVTSNPNAGLYAKSLIGTGFSLNNNGSTQTVGSGQNISGVLRAAAPSGGITPREESGDKSVSGAGAAAASNPAPAASVGGMSFLDANAANGVKGTSFGGLNLSLPNSPNGYFVMAQTPGARYLVETNPLYLGGGSVLGSDYLARLLGYSPDDLAVRLGDASYEAWLVKQQLIAQTGNAVLAGYQGADAQMKSLMEHAAGQSMPLGLAYGKALTPEQQAGLTQDIVWMVQTVIDGKSVLAPVVYLAQSTKASIASGAVISAETANLSLSSLTNTGGTLIGSKSLVVASAGDITNMSGLIKGGDVSLASTGGSIVNKTVSSSGGGEHFYSTVVGKTAGIESSGNLALGAKKDITNVGANISAGGNAALSAGANISFDTIEKKDTNTTYANLEVKNGGGYASTTTTTVNQVKSGLTVGKNLGMAAGSDITLAGTDAKAGGNADLQAGGNVNVVARENSTVTHSESKASGLGMNNSLYGTTTTVTDSTSIRNVGSTLQVGGDAAVTAGRDITFQGSSADVKGSGQLNATNVNVLAGRNYDETTSTTTRSGVLQVSGGSGKSSASGSNSDSSSGRGRAAASADASAEASGQGSGGLAFKSTTTTETHTADLQHVGSTLSFGKDLDVKASQDVNLQGSAVNAAGNVNVDARNVNLLAAQDVRTSTTTVTTTTVGLMASSDNKAGAQAGASANAAGGQGNPGAGASASAGAQASSENRVDVFQRQQDTTETLDVTNRGSAINAGKSLTVKAGDTLTLQGSDLSSGNASGTGFDKSMNLSANNMRFEAVQDVHETRTSSERTTAGLYASGNAQVSAQGGGKVGMGAQGGGSVGGSASGEVGVYGSDTRSSSVDGATTARTSSLKSGGDINRTATNNITDVGTRIDGQGSLNQSAKTIDSFAAANTTYSSAESTTHTAKVGAYAEGSAEASATLQPAPGVQGKGKALTSGKAAGAGAGARASYEYQGSSESAGSSEAVVSSIRMGGSVNSRSSGKTTMEGTQIEATRGDVNLSAASLDYRAAADTSSADSQSKSAKGTVSIDLANQGGSAEVGYSGDKRSDRSSTAVVGGIKAGGNLNLQTSGDMRLEGTNLSAGQGASIDAGGKLDFAAAKNTASGSSESLAVDASVSAGRGGGSGNASVNSAKSNYSLDQDVAGSVSAGQGPVSIRSGGDASFTGTAIASKEGNVSVAAGGDVTMKAARTVAHSESTQVGVSANGLADNNANGQSFNAASGATSTGSSGGGGAKTKVDRRAGGAELGVGTGKADSDTANVGSISSGSGTVSISSGRNTSLEGTQVGAAQGISVNTGGSFEMKEAVSTRSASNTNFSAVGSANTQTPTGKAAGAKGSKAGTTAPSSGATGQAAAKPSAKDKGVQLGAARQLPGGAAPASKPAAGATPAGSATPAGNATPVAGNATTGTTAPAKRSNIQLGSNRDATHGAAAPASGGAAASTPAKPASASASAPADANSPADGNTGWTAAKPTPPSTTGSSAWQAAKPAAGSTNAAQGASTPASTKTTAKKPPPDPYAYQGGTGVADVYVDEQSNRSSQAVKLDGGSGGIVINQGVSPAAKPEPAAAKPSAADAAQAAMDEQMKAKVGERQSAASSAEQAKQAQARQAQAEAKKQADAKLRASEKASEDAAAQVKAMTQLLEAQKKAAEQAR